MVHIPAIVLPAARAHQRHIGAMRAIALNIPDPAVFSQYLPERMADALRSAWKRGTSEYTVCPSNAEALRPYGLVGYGTDCLTAYGLKVRKALLAGTV